MRELTDITPITHPGFNTSDALSEFERDHVLVDHVNDLNDAVRDLQSDMDQQNQEWRMLKNWNRIDQPRYTVAELREKMAKGYFPDVPTKVTLDEFLDWLSENP